MGNNKFITLLSISFIVSLFVLNAGCDNQGEDANQQAEPVTLNMYHWMGTEAGPAISEINALFHQQYPLITIKYENAPVDQYQHVIETRFVSGDVPDIIGVFPGTWINPFVKSGYLMDLSDSLWASRLTEQAKQMMMVNGKLYAMPIDQNAIGVIYNKKIFRSLHLEVPQSWSQFLEVCEKIKAANLTPLALGIKDLWVTQIIPYAMAPTAIYRDKPDFDWDMYDGKASFTKSPWEQMLRDYVELNKRGFFNSGSLGTSYDQMVHLLASEKAAMMVMGSWALGPIHLENPAAEIGMFPLPYNQVGEAPWVSLAVSIGIGASATTKHPNEVKQYLEFWARPEINAMFLKEARAFATFKDITLKMDSAQQQMEPYFTTGTYSFLDQRWPPGVQETLFQSVQKLMIQGGTTSVNQMLQDLDQVFSKNKSLIEDIPK